MSLATTLRKFATPSNVTSAAGWGGTAAVAALFLVQVRVPLHRRLRPLGPPSPPPPVALASLSLNLFSLQKKKKKNSKQPFDFIKRTLSGSSEEAK